MRASSTVEIASAALAITAPFAGAPKVGDVLKRAIPPAANIAISLVRIPNSHFRKLIISDVRSDVNR
jgi:hypothetical protein